MTEQAKADPVHTIVFDAVMEALKKAQPRLPHDGAAPIAAHVALNASARIHALLAKLDDQGGEHG